MRQGKSLQNGNQKPKKRNELLKKGFWRSVFVVILSKKGRKIKKKAEKKSDWNSNVQFSLFGGKSQCGNILPRTSI